MTISTLSGMLRVRMDIPQKVGTWQGPETGSNYVVPFINKVILIHSSDRKALQEQYGKDYLPVIN